MRNPSRCFLPHRLFLQACSGIIFLSLFFLCSCRMQKQLQYLQGPIDTATISQIDIPEPVIQKGDLIGITVFSDNADASAAFNQQMNNPINAEPSFSGVTSNGIVGSSNREVAGYLVDRSGKIYFHSLGPIDVAGLTKLQLALLLQQKLNSYLKNPYCDIRFLNYKFTILGEVTRQGVYTIPGERMNIFEALGIAGDMTIYGLKDSVLIIRSSEGKRNFGILNVNDPNVFLSPYFNLQQNDLIIVKASKKKPGVSEQTNARSLAMVATFATIITSVTVLLNIILR